MRFLTNSLIIISLGLACSKLTPSQPMSDSEFATAYAEYLSVITSDSAKIENRAQYLEEILAENGRTVEEFSKTWNALNTKPEKWQKIMQDVIERMQEKQLQHKEESAIQVPDTHQGKSNEK